MRNKNWLSAALLLISPSLYAHTGGHFDHSLMSGFLHPLTGIDHLLVLIAVGMIAAKQKSKALAFPVIFMILMAAGAFLNVFSINIPYVELLIALSLLAFGLLVTLNKSPNSKLLILCISFFAVVHGYVHATEIPADANAMSYFSALMLMSLAICLGGCALGLVTGKRMNYLFSLICLSNGLYYLFAG